MKTLYLDIFSGLSGDMFLGAMIDLGVDARALELELAKLRLAGYHLHWSRKQKANIDGVKFEVHLAPKPDHGPTHAAGGIGVHGPSHAHGGHEHGPHHGDEPPADRPPGAHGGPIVETSHGRVELSVFETKVPPRFRLYFQDAKGKALAPPAAKSVTLETIRPDQKQQSFKFKRRGDFLEATELLPEPHEFRAILKLKHGARPENVEIEFVEDHHHHPPADEPGHDHAHGRNFSEIKDLIQRSSLSDWVKRKSVAVFHRVAVAEGRIHGLPPEAVHFHEVGAVDSIIDIVGACIALEMLGQPRVLAAPVVDGTGLIRCAHGRFPLPAPATLAILGARGIGVTQCEEPHELVTPTGAALLAEWVEEFGPMKNLVATKIGYGLGTRDHQTRPNVVRAILGTTSAESADAGNDWVTDTVAVLETNLDDISAEILGHFIDLALAAGALDVFHAPIQMKKNRPGVLLTVLCPEADADRFTEMMIRETSTFGVRRYAAERRKIQREFAIVKTPHGEVTIKVGKLNGRIVHASPEFESCKKLAGQAGIPLKQIYEAAHKAFSHVA